MTDGSDGALLARLFIDGQLVDEAMLTIDPGRPELLALKHRDLAALADREGKWWRLEITDPDGLIEPIIMSNRPDDMHLPIAIPLE